MSGELGGVFHDGPAPFQGGDQLPVLSLGPRGIRNLAHVVGPRIRDLKVLAARGRHHYPGETVSLVAHHAANLSTGPKERKEAESLRLRVLFRIC